MKDKLRRFIYECSEKDRCDFYDSTVIDKIFNAFKDGENNHELWLNIFEKIIGRIKAGKQSTPDFTNKDGKKIFLPIDHKKCMVVFFKPQPERRYLIYDFKIIDR